MREVAALLNLSTAYHACGDVDSLLKTAAGRIGEALKARAALIWLPSEDGRLTSRGRWFGAGIRFKARVASEGLVVDILESARAQRLSAQQARPERFSHLADNDRELVKTALYAPIPGPQGVGGVLEVLNKTEGEFTAEDQAFAEQAAQITGVALATHLAAERELYKGLDTIERLTTLYDVSRAFNSVLELQELVPIVADKIRDIMRAEVCNLWLVDSEGERVYFAQQVGEDPTTGEDDQMPLGEGLVGFVAMQGEARLVTNPDQEPLLAARRERAPEFSIRSVLIAPLLKDEQVLGVVEVLNKADGTVFDDDDLFFLTNIAEQTAIAVNNARLLEAERKVHELDALLAISKEITSTLNLDHVLSTVVHQAATVVPFDRCVIGLFDRNRFILGAVSGEAEVPQTSEMEQLRTLLERVADQSEAVRADNYDEGWRVNAEGLRAPVTTFLDTNEFNGFYAIPLRDEQGVVGVMALLSGDAEFLSENHIEVLDILASQTTVAIRNARLYQEVPLMSVWQPLAEKRKKLMALPHARWMEIGWKVGLAVLLLVVIPWKFRVESNAAVVPAERRVVPAEVEGVIERVLVREAEQVGQGQLLAQLDDSDSRVLWQRARTNLDLARRQLGEADSRRDLGAIQQARLRTGLYEAEEALYREKVQKAELRSPIAGVIVTPKVEERVGEHLEAGDAFCEVVEQARMAVEMNVPETDVDLIQPGAQVAIKLNTFPTDTFVGTVERVSAQTLTAEGEQFFVVRALFPNPDTKVRSGMVGRAKITAAGGWFESGWYPVGYVMLRAPAAWLWRKLWSWIP